MGVESSAILVRWIMSPEARPCPLDELIVIAAQVGDEVLVVSYLFLEPPPKLT
jgi:hypothetical protein